VIWRLLAYPCTTCRADWTSPRPADPLPLLKKKGSTLTHPVKAKKKRKKKQPVSHFASLPPPPWSSSPPVAAQADAVPAVHLSTVPLPSPPLAACADAVVMATMFGARVGTRQ
jgi:hypothetical protein